MRHGRRARRRERRQRSHGATGRRFRGRRAVLARRRRDHHVPHGAHRPRMHRVRGRFSLVRGRLRASNGQRSRGRVRGRMRRGVLRSGQRRGHLLRRRLMRLCVQPDLRALRRGMRLPGRAARVLHRLRPVLRRQRLPEPHDMQRRHLPWMRRELGRLRQQPGQRLRDESLARRQLRVVRKLVLRILLRLRISRDRRQIVQTKRYRVLLPVLSSS